MSFRIILGRTAIVLLSLFFITITNIASAATQHMSGPNSPQMTTEQVKTAIKKKHKGRIISISKKSKTGHPNCHVVKIATPTGGMKYIRYACK